MKTLSFKKSNNLSESNWITFNRRKIKLLQTLSELRREDMGTAALQMDTLTRGHRLVPISASVVYKTYVPVHRLLVWEVKVAIKWN